MGSASALEKTEHVPGSIWGSRSIHLDHSCSGSFACVVAPCCNGKTYC